MIFAIAELKIHNQIFQFNFLSSRRICVRLAVSVFITKATLAKKPGDAKNMKSLFEKISCQN